jgi:catechol-2,3-dioxygenase
MRVHELGHAVLYVSDLERSRRFYRDLLGFHEVGSLGGMGAMFSSGRTHHELLLLEVGEGAEPIPAGRRIGLYHLGFKIGTSDDELRAALGEVRAAGADVVGTADHTVTHSLYLHDPDGNEIELYVDVQPERWRDDPQAALVPTRPLSL